MTPVKQKKSFKQSLSNFWKKTQEIGPYIKLQTKLEFTSSKVQKTSKKILTAAISALVFAIILIFAYFLFKALTSQSTFISGSAVTILIFTIAQFLLLIVSISLQTKRLHKPDDLRIISTFPLTSFQKYVGEIITIYIKLLVYSVIFFYPFIIVYGVAGGLIGAEAGAGNSTAFCFSSLFASVLLPLLPFTISLVFSVPFMYLKSWLQNKNIVKLILFIILFITLITIYALLLRFMSDWWIHAHNDTEVMKGIASFLDSLNKPYNFCYFTSQICLFNAVGVNLGILIGISAAFMIVGVLITKPLYDHFIKSSANLESVATYKHTHLTEGGAFKEIFVKEIKQMVRTQTYAFFYLGVAFAMPILTYLITDVVKDLGQAQTGSTSFFGFGLLILCIIVSLIGSYSANIISKEGKQFYISKTIPLSYRKQLLAKSSVNFFVSFGGLLLCIIVLACTVTSTGGQAFTISVGDLFILFGICTLFLVGITFNGININLIRPKVEIINGQPSESNIVIQLVISLIITAIMCTVIMVIDGIFGKAILWLHISALIAMAIYALINFLVFYFTAEKKYAAMEVK